MSAQEEEINLIYALRAIQVLLDAGVGIEAALSHLSKGGYGRISDDFSKVLQGIDKGQRMEDEIRRLVIRSKSDDYLRLLNSILNNITSNTDMLGSLEQQATRAEENRNDKLKRYIEQLSGLPEMALTIGFLAPLILGLAALAPFLMGGLGDIASIPDQGTMLLLYNGGMLAAVVALALMLVGVKTKDPGV